METVPRVWILDITTSLRGRRHPLEADTHLEKRGEVFLLHKFCYTHTHRDLNPVITRMKEARVEVDVERR